MFFSVGRHRGALGVIECAAANADRSLAGDAVVAANLAGVPSLVVGVSTVVALLLTYSWVDRWDGTPIADLAPGNSHLPRDSSAEHATARPLEPLIRDPVGFDRVSDQTR
jgi:hypothetical protein